MAKDTVAESGRHGSESPPAERLKASPPERATVRCMIRGIGKGFVPGSPVRLYGFDMEVVGDNVEGDIPAQFVENEIAHERMERVRG